MHKLHKSSQGLWRPGEGRAGVRVITGREEDPAMPAGQGCEPDGDVRELLGQRLHG